ncbi:hypothetical protein L1887_28447 [Cichorium endivia]|nr:hypothetical protein L1887_28447 [Cichorium endivia]
MNNRLFRNSINSVENVVNLILMTCGLNSLGYISLFRRRWTQSAARESFLESVNDPVLTDIGGSAFKLASELQFSFDTWAFKWAITVITLDYTSGLIPISVTFWIVVISCSPILSLLFVLLVLSSILSLLFVTRISLGPGEDDLPLFLGPLLAGTILGLR